MDPFRRQGKTTLTLDARAPPVLEKKVRFLAVTATAWILIAPAATVRAQSSPPAAAGAVGGGGDVATGGGTGGCPGGMVFVPGGTMRVRGDTATVASYCMDVTEVTVDAYRACVQNGNCTPAATGDGRCNWSKNDRGNHPINCVDWNQATAYCAALGKRLPTEEEWEWAARGGERGTTYPWGNEAPGSRACWSRSQGTCPVGSFRKGDSPLGIHDLAGNVWEWTASKYLRDSLIFPKRRVDIRIPLRVDRGGGWPDDEDDSLRAGYRVGLAPSDQFNYLGFRCARTR